MPLGPADKLDWQTIQNKLKELGGGWSFDPEKNIILKTFKRKDFTDATQFAATIAPIANGMDHHPDLLVHGYKNVDVMISTHSAGGITQNDFDLAAAIEKLP